MINAGLIIDLPHAYELAGKHANTQIPTTPISTTGTDAATRQPGRSPSTIQAAIGTTTTAVDARRSLLLGYTAAGASILVAGSAVFGQKDRSAAMDSIRSAVSTHVM